jgi:hypothetical protein
MVDQSKEKVCKTRFIGFPKGMKLLWIFIFAIIGFFIIVLYNFIMVFIEGFAFFSKEGRDFLMFNIFVSIPVKELVFRGLLYDIIYIIVIELFIQNNKKKFKYRARSLGIDNIAHFCSILLSSITFAMYHLYRYGYDLWTIIYLLILGVILGLLRRFFGLFAPYLTHVFNNIAADFDA